MNPVEEQAPPPASRGIFGYLVLAIAVGLAFGVGAYLFASGNDEPDAITPADLGATPYPNTGPLEPNRPEEGEPAPDFALVNARDTSKVIKLSDFRGKAVILNWYASWCGPCKNEIPAFLRAQEAIGDDLTILGVDFLESPEKAVSILDELGAEYPAVLDAGGTVAEHYRNGNGVPVTFFIDKDGILRATRRGEVFEKDLPDYLAKIGLQYSP
jgi:peroxiredoxin